MNIETKDGVYLSGEFTGTKESHFELDGREVNCVQELQLDNDPEKVVDVARIVRAEVVRE